MQLLLVNRVFYALPRLEGNERLEHLGLRGEPRQVRSRDVSGVVEEVKPGQVEQWGAGGGVVGGRRSKLGQGSSRSQRTLVFTLSGIRGE